MPDATPHETIRRLQTTLDATLDSLARLQGALAECRAGMERFNREWFEIAYAHRCRTGRDLADDMARPAAPDEE